MAVAAPPHDTDFQRTRWSLVAALDDQAANADSTQVRQRLLELCLRYWYPVYVYLRRSGHPPAAAQALTARFFAMLLHTRVRGGRGRDGRFRTWLLAELHRFLATPDAQQLEPVESELPMPSLEALERRRAREDPDGGSPELALQRGVALELIARAMQRIEKEASQAGRLPMFAALQPFLASDPLPGVYADIAQRLDVSPLFLALALKRLRERFRELVDGELVQTVASAGALDAERRILHAALSGDP